MLGFVISCTAPIQSVLILAQHKGCAVRMPRAFLSACDIPVAITQDGRQVWVFDPAGHQKRIAISVGVDFAVKSSSDQARHQQIRQIALHFIGACRILAFCGAGHELCQLGDKAAVINEGLCRSDRLIACGQFSSP